MAVVFDTVQLGPIKEGRQTITLPDAKKGVYIQCETTPQKVDEYMSSRKDIEKKAGAKEAISLVAGTVCGMVIAALKMKSDLVGKLVCGGGMGFLIGLIGALGFLGAAEYKIQKLNEKFINDNQ